MSGPVPLGVSRSAPAALALGLLLSVPAAAPALLRTIPHSSAPASALALVGSVSLVVVPIGLWLRGSKRAGVHSLLLGAGLSCLPLAIFASVLKSSTHHRPLGGATFAVVACVVLALGVGLSFKAVHPDAVKATWRKRVLALCSLLSVAVTAALLLRADRSALIDALVMGGASAAAGSVRIPVRLQRLALAPVLAAWAALLLAAVMAIRNPPLAASLTSRAPISFAALSWLGGSS